MANLYKLLSKLNPLLWLVHTAAGRNRALPANLEHLTKPILKAYAIKDDDTDTYPEVIVIHRESEGNIDWFWRESTKSGEGIRETVARAYVNATAEWDKIQSADVYAVMAENNRKSA